MKEITLSCSPDADDLFMVRALLDGSIDTGGYCFVIDTQPTDSLNRLASGDGPDVVAISVAHYPAVAQGYQMLPHGGSMGENYGPVVVSPKPMTLADLRSARIAVPGLTTTAYTTLRMITEFIPEVVPITPYERIFEAMERGEVDAGLIIHEGRLTYEDRGLFKVLDIGEWWYEHTRGLPLPLGANAIKRSLGSVHITAISSYLRESIRHALQDRTAAIQWLLDRKGPLNTETRVSQYLHMYANERTLDYGKEGRDAVQTYLTLAHERGLLPQAVVDFAP